MIAALVKKAQIPDEAEAGRIRIYEASSNKFYREPPRDHPVTNLNEYTQIYAERVPEEETIADDGNFISVFHFQNEANRAHGTPFKFLIIEVGYSLDSVRNFAKMTDKCNRARNLPTPRRGSRSGPVSRAKASRRSSLQSCGARLTRNHSI